MEQEIEYKYANYSSVILMILKDIRLEKGVHQGAIAERIGKTPSAWTKIENGQSNLTVDVLVGACSVLQTSLSQIENWCSLYIPILSAHGFHIQVGHVSTEEDQLLKYVSDYYNSKGYEKIKHTQERVGFYSYNPLFLGTTKTPTIVRYCSYIQYRDWINSGAEGVPPACYMDIMNFENGF
ncbi:helix-turn-helix transcriptional regulator [Vibrio sp. H11]|uniref:helix-turn-helix domain-containing protein n=1 Tax=Vibrio sp. H11 TaxID=2565928 RepID=UPI0010A669D3|nr:helix-turn-helix transcriptional regulator [Vibrio sp. H11]